MMSRVEVKTKKESLFIGRKPKHNISSFGAGVSYILLALLDFLFNLNSFMQIFVPRLFMKSLLHFYLPNSNLISSDMQLSAMTSFFFFFIIITGLNFLKASNFYQSPVIFVFFLSTFCLSQILSQSTASFHFAVLFYSL